jgi:hypothetical protein
MRKSSILFGCLMLLCLNLFAQAPQAFKYQAILRSASGILVNQVVNLQISILQGSANGSSVYTETQADTSNSLGLLSLNIGKGTSTDVFDSIKWSNGPYFLKIEVDVTGGSNFSPLGTAQLLSVPYALFAEHGNQGPKGDKGDPGVGSGTWTQGQGSLSTADKVGVGISSPNGMFVVRGNDSIPADTALFEVKNKLGQTVFAVYENGAELIVNEGVKGAKGGFSVGGRAPGKGTTQDIMLVSPDSIRIYITDNPLQKGARGGFAIGGKNATKASGWEYLRVTPDSTRIYINQTAKGARGGFSVGSRSPVKGGIESFTYLESDNYFIGQGSGKNITTGLYNLFLGYQSGLNNQTGSNNVLLGYQSGMNNVFGYDNVFLGSHSGMNNTGQDGTANGSSNVFIGTSSGFSNTIGSQNIFIGGQSGGGNLSGGSNIYLGYYSGMSNQAGSLNICIGNYAGLNNTSNRNIFIGELAGNSSTTGSDQVFIGNQSGQMNTTGAGNTFLGSLTGWYNTTGSNNVFFGAYAASNQTKGDNNVYIGSGVRQYKSDSSSNNVYIGSAAGQNSVGSGNVFLGYYAGSDETNSNRLYITNYWSGPTTSLIYGEFDNQYLRFNGTVHVNDLLKLEPRAAAPVSPSEGEIYYDSSTHKLRVYDGTVWQNCF